MKFLKHINRLSIHLLPQIFIAIFSTFIILLSASLFAYYFLYNHIQNDYMQKRRNIIQITCGRSENDERIYTLVPGLCKFWNGEFDTQVPINKLGYRHVRQTANPNSPLLVVSGDSHAMGWGVKDGKDISSIISLNGKYRVKNLSMSSYGTARELITLKKFAPDAKVILLQYCDNDLKENEAFIHDPIQFVNEYEKRLANFKSWKKSYEKFSANNYYQRLLLNKTYGYVSLSWQLMGLTPKDLPANNNMLNHEAKIFAKTLNQFRDYLENKIVIVFESNGSRALRPNFVQQFKKEVRKLGLKQISFIDSNKLLKSSDYYFVDDHLRESGHRKIAEKTIQTIKGLLKNDG